MPKVAEGEAARPVSPYKFKGHTVQVPVWYSEGHVMDADDARFANRQLASVNGNILASAIARLLANRQEEMDKLPDTVDDGNGNLIANPAVVWTADGKRAQLGADTLSGDEVQSMFDDIFGRYEIGKANNRGDGSSIHDPVESIARNMAWELGVKPLLRAQGFKINEVKADKKNELVDQYLDAFPNIRETAKAQFEAANAAGPAVAGLDLSGLTKTEAAANASGGDAPTADATPEADTPAEGETEAQTEGRRGRRSEG